MADVFDVADNIESYSENEIARVMADAGVSLALDNGSDILGEDPREHAEEHWHAYIGHMIELFMDELHFVQGDEYDDSHIDYQMIYWKAIFEAPSMWTKHGYDLHMDDVSMVDTERFGDLS